MSSRSRTLAITRADLEQTIVARFETIVDLVPEREALRGRGRSWTYGELNRAANLIAHAIRRRTPTPPGRVAYLAQQSPEMVVATLAILKAGATYTAIHPRLPRAAQREILADVAPALLLTTPECEHDARAIAAGLCEVLVLDSVDEPRDDNPPHLGTARDASTLFYTSGSTGRPKGVLKSHRAVLHRVWLSALYDGIAIDDRQSLLTHCSFSASESDMFGALLQGATVCTFDIAAQGFAEFGEWIDSEEITLLHPPVLFFRRFLAALKRDRVFSRVRIVALAGDTVLPSDVLRWQEHFTRDCVLLHRFSITETALLTVARIDHGADADALLTGGRPVPDKTLLVVDDEGAPAAPGEAGELIVQSDYLADGYWNRAEERAAAFSLAEDGSGLRVYRTGDIGSFTPEGAFVPRGRRDEQVKIRGFRVELPEVDAALMQVETVREAACIAVTQEGETCLHAFIVWKDGHAFPPAAIRARLGDLLPEWKIPEEFHSVDSLPATLTGKVDRRSLRDLLGSAPRDEQSGDRNAVRAVWSRVLRRDVGLDDRFFEELGGTSLDALQIVSEIESNSRRRLPLSLVIELNTVRKMSAYLDASADRERTVVALQTGGSLPPVFCVSGKGGSVIPFRGLAEQLGSDQPFYGLTHHGLDPETRPATLAALAASYVKGIREQQPEGPYFLAGYSAGGLVAFEVARQLARAGHRVAFIGLLDTSASSERGSPWKRARKYVQIFRRRPGASAIRYAQAVARRVANAVQWARSGRWPVVTPLPQNEFYDSLNLLPSLQPWSGPVTLFLARQGTGAECALRDAGWKRICGPALEIVDVEGEHDTMLTSEVQGLARAFSDALARARTRTRPAG